MVFHILTLFPKAISCYFQESIMRRAIERGIIDIYLLDIRDYSIDKHRKVDDYPFGGGRGMLMAPDPLFRAIESIEKRGHVIYFSPKGYLLNQRKVRELIHNNQCLTLVCGHYEGIDNRVVEHLIDEEISTGDYILTGGELAAAILVDAITRELNETLGNRESRLEESFDESGLLEYEQYTRPADYRGYRVPDILLSGDHKKIEKWQMQRRLLNTLKRRPDLIDKSSLSPEYRKLLKEVEEERKNEPG